MVSTKPNTLVEPPFRPEELPAESADTVVLCGTEELPPHSPRLVVLPYTMVVYNNWLLFLSL